MGLCFFYGILMRRIRCPEHSFCIFTTISAGAGWIQYDLELCCVKKPANSSWDCTHVGEYKLRTLAISANSTIDKIFEGSKPLPSTDDHVSITFKGVVSSCLMDKFVFLISFTTIGIEKRLWHWKVFHQIFSQI